jgi:hypothetical protein
MPMPNDTLYDTDIVAWSEHQAALLRRLARGERVNDQMDWDNLVEDPTSPPACRTKVNGHVSPSGHWQPSWASGSDGAAADGGGFCFRPAAWRSMNAC